MSFWGERVAASARGGACAGFVLVLLATGCGGGGGGGNGGGAGAAGDTTYPVTLSWDPVTVNDDGTPVGDLVGYRVYDGPKPGLYNMMTELPNVTTATLELSKGTFYIAVTAFDTSGNESGFSNEVAVTVP